MSEIDQVKKQLFTALQKLNCYTDEQIKQFLTDFDYNNFLQDLGYFYNHINQNGTELPCLTLFTKEKCPLFVKIESSEKESCDGCSFFSRSYNCQRWNKTFLEFYKTLTVIILNGDKTYE